MKKLISSVALVFIAGTANAATDSEVYHGFAKGNPDLETGSAYAITRTAVQPGIGSSTGMMRTRGLSDNQIYHGFERGNPDLYSGSSQTDYSVASVPGIGSGSATGRHSGFSHNDIYHGFEKGNPDL